MPLHLHQMKKWRRGTRQGPGSITCDMPSASLSVYAANDHVPLLMLPAGPRELILQKLHGGNGSANVRSVCQALRDAFDTYAPRLSLGHKSATNTVGPALARQEEGQAEGAGASNNKEHEDSSEEEQQEAASEEVVEAQPARALTAPELRQLVRRVSARCSNLREVELLQPRQGVKLPLPLPSLLEVRRKCEWDARVDERKGSEGDATWGGMERGQSDEML